MTFSVILLFVCCFPINEKYHNNNYDNSVTFECHYEYGTNTWLLFVVALNEMLPVEFSRPKGASLNLDLTLVHHLGTFRDCYCFPYEMGKTRDLNCDAYILIIMFFINSGLVKSIIVSTMNFRITLRFDDWYLLKILVYVL